MSKMNRAVERAIRRGTGATGIVDVDEVQPVWGGNGKVLRVSLRGAVVDSVVVKHIALPPGARGKKKSKDVSLLQTLLSYDNELTFYQKYSKELPEGVRVPNYHSGQSLEDGWVFVLEDLRESGFLMAKKSYEESDIGGALRWLARFHAHFLGNAGEGLWKAGSYWNLASGKDENVQMTHPGLKAAAVSLDNALNQCRFKTLIHGDSKVDNFCFSGSKDGEVAGVDFQYVGLGCGMKDVICLLDSCLSPFDAEVQAPGYLESYFVELRQALILRVGSSNAASVEEEWRALHPLAWADYYRFLDGWAPGKYPPEGFVETMMAQAVAHLARN